VLLCCTGPTASAVDELDLGLTSASSNKVRQYTSTRTASVSVKRVDGASNQSRCFVDASPSRRRHWQWQDFLDLSPPPGSMASPSSGYRWGPFISHHWLLFLFPPNSHAPCTPPFTVTSLPQTNMLSRACYDRHPESKCACCCCCCCCCCRPRRDIRAFQKAQ
jgi:hypothetical protein